MAITTLRTIEPEFLDLYREEVEEEFWENQTLTLYGVIGEAEWAYFDFEHPEVEKTVQRAVLVTESSRPVAGLLSFEGDYNRRAELHVSGEVDTPENAIRTGIFINEGDQDWMTEYYDGEGDMFTTDAQSRRIHRISTRARGYEFRCSLKCGDLFQDDHGKYIISIPTVEFRMRN